MVTFAVDMAISVGVEPNLPRTARCWSRYRNNAQGEDSETYYRRSIAISVMNDLITNLQDGMSARNHTEYLLYCHQFVYPLISILNKAQQNFTNYSKRNLI